MKKGIKKQPTLCVRREKTAESGMCFQNQIIKYINIESSKLKTVWGAHKSQKGVDIKMTLEVFLK